MEFEKWIGRHVTVFRINDDRTYSARVDGWDPEKGRLQLGPKPVYISADDILKIMPSEPGPFRRGPAAGVSAHPHSVGYVLNDSLQYENAILFRSPVTVWKGDRVIRYRAIIVAHDKVEVTLRSGEKLLKQEYCFVARSIRGN
ncbi:hypothetical protein [Paenibacillus caui]|uniref:hypothetical protein n=1 Tax=Paenibacillus caui TaxID=2873927 RepID=UPI001CA9B4D7|nr:hypothetical protein [Paenibacillus caui]